MPLPADLIVSVSGIRGRVGTELTPEVVARCAALFGTYARRSGWSGHLIVARDSRPSGSALTQVAAAGLRSVGCRVSDLGIVPTPTALLAIQDRGLGGGVIVTASHNPKEWNALKLAGSEGTFLTPQQGATFAEMLNRDERPDYAQWDGYGTIENVPDAVENHIARILELDIVERDRITDRGFRVVLDCARGAGGVLMPALLEALGCEVVGLDLEPDGCFTRELEPIPSNLHGLGERVRTSGADLGFAVDPDVDRLALVDEAGEPIGEDFTLALAVELVLRHRSGPVVANLSTSQVVQEAASRGGAPFHRSPVGEANVAGAIREVGAVIGGEGNGGVIYPVLHNTRDAPLAAALVLQLLTETGSRLGERVERYTRCRIMKDKIERPELELGELYSEIEEALPGAEVDRRDGLHLQWPDRRTWLHVRPSGTEPILRILVEGPVSSESDLEGMLETVKQLVITS